MTLISIILIAVGLAMDAFAVSVSCGLAVKPLRISYALRIAFFFGAFQAVMPVIGWAAGVSLRVIITSFDHWVAFILLMAIGCRMIYESFKKEKKSPGGNAVSMGGLLVLSLATSIDALAVGISFAFLKETILFPSLTIGSVTFILCFVGVWLGNRFGHIFENKFEMIGGLVLIGIAVKILISHLTG